MSREETRLIQFSKYANAIGSPVALFAAIFYAVRGDWPIAALAAGLSISAALVAAIYWRMPSRR